eukprot:TRINITY_DN67103_c0_g1_i1.p1 TRINITY_DN67103_c0_g1~~TRINITY_DN67103_c0_g1_i1.p1  ORF type:complete len:478 (-),score=83.95 TRINITY_DN67103_c0_g1_i1:56-1489(-)
MKAKRPQDVKGTNLAEKYRIPGRCTTVMIRNVPLEYTQDELIDEVQDLLGSTIFFDFFYLPWDMQNCSNVGYAFVNFQNAIIAQKAVCVFSNYRFRTYPSNKPPKVLPAHIQGLEHNLRHLQDRAVVHGNHPYSPVVVWEGKTVEVARIFQELTTEDAIRRFNEHSRGSRGGIEDGDSGGERDTLRGCNSSADTIDQNFARVLSRVAASCSDVGSTKIVKRGLTQSNRLGGYKNGGMSGEFALAPMSMGAANAGCDNSYTQFMPGIADNNRVSADKVVDVRKVQSSHGRLTGNDRRLRHQAVDMDRMGFGIAAETGGRAGFAPPNVLASDLFEVGFSRDNSAYSSEEAYPPFPPGLEERGFPSVTTNPEEKFQADEEIHRRVAPGSSSGMVPNKQAQQDTRRLLMHMEEQQGCDLKQRPQAPLSGMQAPESIMQNLPPTQEVQMQSETPIQDDGVIQISMQDADSDVLKKFFGKFGG